MMTQTATEMKSIGEWTKLEDGTWGAQWRGAGGRAQEFVGRTGRVRAKDGKMKTVRLVAVSKDYGTGDVATYVVTEKLGG